MTYATDNDMPIVSFIKLNFFDDLHDIFIFKFMLLKIKWPKNDHPATNVICTMFRYGEQVHRS